MAPNEETLLVRIDALEKLLDERKEHYDRALKIQAAEYQRRLDMLNGEAERLRNMQATYVLRESHEKDIQRIDEKVQNINLWIANLQGKLLIVSGVITLATVVVIKLLRI